MDDTKNFPDDREPDTEKNTAIPLKLLAGVEDRLNLLEALRKNKNALTIQKTTAPEYRSKHRP